MVHIIGPFAKACYTTCTTLDCSVVGYLLDCSLRDCVGRLGVFEQLEDLLKSLLIWLPLHPEKRRKKNVINVGMGFFLFIFLEINRVEKSENVVSGSDSMNTNTITESDVILLCISSKNPH